MDPIQFGATGYLFYVFHLSFVLMSTNRDYSIKSVRELHEMEQIQKWFQQFASTWLLVCCPGLNGVEESSHSFCGGYLTTSIVSEKIQRSLLSRTGWVNYAMRKLQSILQLYAKTRKCTVLIYRIITSRQLVKNERRTVGRVPFESIGTVKDINC